MNENIESYEQYSRAECLQIADIPDIVDNSLLGETALNIFEELGVSINPSEIEAFHLAQLLSWKKVITKMS